jgi:Matrixin
MPRMCRLAVEALEDRATPVVWNSPWVDPDHMTISFAPDGTDIHGKPSTLFGEMRLAPTDEWRREALRAFQTWAAAANINLALVPDLGIAFGTSGPLQGDPRHGDVRLGATNLGAGEIAATTPFDLLGGWSGSVLLNTVRSFNLGGTGGAADLYTVLLQEAGHVFGIANSLDPASVMYEQYHGPRVGLDASDILDIRSLYGARVPDRFEGRLGNGNLRTATPLGSTVRPIAVNADLTATGDVDIYRVRASGRGPVAVRLTTTGVSLLTARLTVFDATGRLVATTVANDPTSGDLNLTIPGGRAGATYFLRVEAAQDDVFGIGAYRLSVGSPDTTGTPTASRIAARAAPVAKGPVFLGTQSARPNGRWDFSQRARLSDPSGTDTYLVRARTSGTMIVAVWGLDPGGLDPRVMVRDQSGRAVPTEVLSDATGVSTLQVRGAKANSTYRILVGAADPHIPTNGGRYLVGIDFRNEAINSTQLAAGTLTAAQKDRSAIMAVTQSELLHFALATATANAGIESAARLIVRDQLGREVYTLFANAAQTVSGDVLLGAGRYTVVVTGGTRRSTDRLPDLSFALAVLVRDDPIGIGLVDPSSDPTKPPSAPPPDATSTKPYEGPYTGPYRFL